LVLSPELEVALPSGVFAHMLSEAVHPVMKLRRHGQVREWLTHRLLFGQPYRQGIAVRAGTSSVAHM